jgi:hypothetical protein
VEQASLLPVIDPLLRLYLLAYSILFLKSRRSSGRRASNMRSIAFRRNSAVHVTLLILSLAGSLLSRCDALVSPIWKHSTSRHVSRSHFTPKPNEIIAKRTRMPSARNQRETMSMANNDNDGNDGEPAGRWGGASPTVLVHTFDAGGIPISVRQEYNNILVSDREQVSLFLWIDIHVCAHTYRYWQYNILQFRRHDGASEEGKSLTSLMPR